MPADFSKAVAVSTPKLKYLKTPRTPRLIATVPSSQTLRRVGELDRAIALPSSQSAVEEPQMRGKKRQSQWA